MNILSEKMPLWMTSPNREKRERYVKEEKKLPRENVPKDVTKIVPQKEVDNHYLPKVNNNQRKFEIKWFILAVILIFLLKIIVKRR